MGELSAINGIAGAYTDHLPVFHLVGMPKMPVQARHGLVHHTLGNGEFDLFQRMSDPVVCASAVMTPQNCAAETERLIAAALYHRRPVYMAFPADLAGMLVVSTAPPIPAPISDPEQVDAAVQAIADMLGRAKSACVLPGPPHDPLGSGSRPGTPPGRHRPALRHDGRRQGRPGRGAPRLRRHVRRQADERGGRGASWRTPTSS